jgi:hypothetical protein
VVLVLPLKEIVEVILMVREIILSIWLAAVVVVLVRLVVILSQT